MQFDFSPKVIALREQLLRFMDEHVYPNEQRREEELVANAKAGRPYAELPVMAGLKAKAREQGLWNLFLPEKEHGPGLTNVEYAPLAEIMGRRYWCSEIFNCSAACCKDFSTQGRVGDAGSNSPKMPMRTASATSSL